MGVQGLAAYVKKNGVLVEEDILAYARNLNTPVAILVDVFAFNFFMSSHFAYGQSYPCLLTRNHPLNALLAEYNKIRAIVILIILTFRRNKIELQFFLDGESGKRDHPLKLAESLDRKRKLFKQAEDLEFAVNRGQLATVHVEGNLPELMTAAVRSAIRRCKCVVWTCRGEADGFMMAIANMRKYPSGNTGNAADYRRDDKSDHCSIDSNAASQFSTLASDVPVIGHLSNDTDFATGRNSRLWMSSSFDVTRDLVRAIGDELMKNPHYLEPSCTDFGPGCDVREIICGNISSKALASDIGIYESELPLVAALAGNDFTKHLLTSRKQTNGRFLNTVQAFTQAAMLVRSHCKSDDPSDDAFFAQTKRFVQDAEGFKKGVAFSREFYGYGNREYPWGKQAHEDLECFERFRCGFDTSATREFPRNRDEEVTMVLGLVAETYAPRFFLSLRRDMRQGVGIIHCETDKHDAVQHALFPMYEFQARCMGIEGEFEVEMTEKARGRVLWKLKPSLELLPEEYVCFKCKVDNKEEFDRRIENILGHMSKIWCDEIEIKPRKLFDICYILLKTIKYKNGDRIFDDEEAINLYITMLYTGRHIPSIDCPSFHEVKLNIPDEYHEASGIWNQFSDHVFADVVKTMRWYTVVSTAQNILYSLTHITELYAGVCAKADPRYLLDPPCMFNGKQFILFHISSGKSQMCVDARAAVNRVYKPAHLKQIEALREIIIQQHPCPVVS